MTQLDEGALIERCRAGDDAAFGELVDRYKDLVYGLIYRLTADRSRVDDLAQDVFLKVHRGLPYFRGEARLSTWIYRIVQNVCSQARAAKLPEVSWTIEALTAGRFWSLPRWTARRRISSCATGSRRPSRSFPRAIGC